VDAALDDASRSLFGLAGLGADDQAARVRHVLGAELGFGCAGCGPRSLLLGEVVAHRAGHPLLLACVGHELTRRAGVVTSVHSSAACWMLRFHDDHQAAYVSFGEPPAEQVDGARRRCSHELAYASLVALEGSFRRFGHLGRARRAVALRNVLPVV